MIVDSGVLIALDRGERLAISLLIETRDAREPIETSHGVVAQVWRSSRQARLARALAAVTVHPIEDGRAIGTLLAASTTDDVVDAHLAMLAVRRSQRVVTSDVVDLTRLVVAAGGDAEQVVAWPLPGR